MSYKIAVLPGDGIGPEVMSEATQVLSQAASRYGFAVELEHGMVGGASIDACGKPLTDAVLKLAKQSDAVLLGGGVRLFDQAPANLELETTRVIDSPRVTHLTYRIVK
jgi:3-isopropylmalate dehydrogenase